VLVATGVTAGTGVLVAVTTRTAFEVRSPFRKPSDFDASSRPRLLEALAADRPRSPPPWSLEPRSPCAAAEGPATHISKRPLVATATAPLRRRVLSCAMVNPLRYLSVVLHRPPDRLLPHQTHRRGSHYSLTLAANGRNESRTIRGDGAPAPHGGRDPRRAPARWRALQRMQVVSRLRRHCLLLASEDPHARWLRLVVPVVRDRRRVRRAGQAAGDGAAYSWQARLRASPAPSSAFRYKPPS